MFIIFAVVLGFIGGTQAGLHSNLPPVKPIVKAGPVEKHDWSNFLATEG